MGVSKVRPIAQDQVGVDFILLDPGADPAPRVAYRGGDPQMTACAPQSEACAPKKLTGLGLLKCRLRPKLVFATGIFVIFLVWHRISWHFWDEDLFFFEDHLFSAGKTAWITDFDRKIPLNLWSSPYSFDPDWDKFLVPPCPSRFHINKLLVPPQKFFLPLLSRYSGAGPAQEFKWYSTSNQRLAPLMS